MNELIQNILEKVQTGVLSETDAEQQYLELISNNREKEADPLAVIVKNIALKQKREFQTDSTFTHRKIELIKAVESPEYRLFVFLPFGFGNETVSWSWKNSFEDMDNVEVWLIGASDISDWQKLIPHLVESMLPLCDLPFIVYGHSMGGIIAYETLIKLEHQYQISPLVFIPSSVASPEVFERIKILPPFYDINDEMDIQDCRNLLEQSQIILPVKSGVKSMTDKAILSDITLLKTYHYHHATSPLSCNVMALQANNDILIKDSVTVTLWKDYTKGYFQFKEIEGTHLYFMNPPHSFFKLIKSFIQNKLTTKPNHFNPTIYRLVSFKTGTEEVNVYPYGIRPEGYLIYQKNGKMAAHIWNPTRKGHGNTQALSKQDAIEKMLTYLSYSGSYQVKQGIIEHAVGVSTDPNFVDDNLIRYYQIDNKNITLVTAPLTTKNLKQSKSSTYSQLIWEEIADEAKYIGHPLIGSWKLTSYQGCKENTLGENPEGILILTDQGYFSMVLTCKDRNLPCFDNLILASNQEIIDALESSISYCGKFEIKDNNQIIFFIEENLINTPAENKMMKYKLSALGLELKNKFKHPETQQMHCITESWKRM